jgi:3-oxoacyl-[acyl-carrier-protein] synthase III
VTDIGLAGWGTYLPQQTRDYNDLATLTGIPAEVIRDKFGVHQVYVAGPDDHASTMGTSAAQQALAHAGLTPTDVNLIIYHGSEFKDHIVWSVATKIQQLLGADHATAFEIYSLCAGAGVALNIARGMMTADPRLQNVLLVAASRELDLLDYTNERGRFMINFSAGGGALLLRRDDNHNKLVGTSVLTDSRLADMVVMAGGGSRHPVSAQSLEAKQHVLDVPDVTIMRDVLGEVSLPNFIRVIREAVEQGGHSIADIRFLGITHMKASFHREILSQLGLSEEQSVYLNQYGHVQSADQAIAIDEGVKQGKIKAGDLVVIAGAGTGYTWSAAAFEWG